MAEHLKNLKVQLRQTPEAVKEVALRYINALMLHDLAAAADKLDTRDTYLAAYEEWKPLVATNEELYWDIARVMYDFYSHAGEYAHSAKVAIKNEIVAELIGVRTLLDEEICASSAATSDNA